MHAFAIKSEPATVAWPWAQHAEQIHAFVGAGTRVFSGAFVAMFAQSKETCSLDRKAADTVVSVRCSAQESLA